MSYLTSFYDHLRHLTAAAQRCGLTGEVKIGSMNAVLRGSGREIEFLAQFLVRAEDGKKTYSMQYRDDAEGFVGWLPYFNKRWPEAHDKFAFKRACARSGLPTPAWSPGGVSGVLGDFVVKSARHSSFGYGVRGPFAAAAANDAQIGEGDYAEQFVPGQIGKAWFWNDRVVAIELREPAGVIGDGSATLAQLVKRARWSANVTDPPEFFRYRGLQWNQVPKAGESVTVDYKYGSPFGLVEYRSANRIDELRQSPVVEQLDRWGTVFWSWVPEPIREGTLYTVDFVLSRDERLWLLEMNCNPMVPPEGYDLIVAAAFDGAVACTGPATMHVTLPNAPAFPGTAATLPPAAPPPTALPPPLPVPVAGQTLAAAR